MTPIDHTKRTLLKKIGGIMLSACCGAGVGALTGGAEPVKQPEPATARERLLELMGMRRPATLMQIPANSNVQEALGERTDQYLLPEAAQAYTAMRNAAGRDGVELVLDWGYRDYELQKQMWNIRVKKWKNLKTVFRYISVPGTSFHHFGTDIDIRGPLPKPLNVTTKDFIGKGKFAKHFIWMRKNSEKFGFHLTYPNTGSHSNGISFEPWHYSFKKLHRPLLKEYLNSTDEIIPIILSDKEILKINTASYTFMKRYMQTYITPALS